MKDIFVDIDNTICKPKDPSRPMDYSDAVPIKKNIAKVNEYYNNDHFRITYWTARGAKTGIDWREVTEQQLKDWGAKYHALRLDKPPFDILIDDKCINSLWNWSPGAFDEALCPGITKLKLSNTYVDGPVN